MAAKETKPEKPPAEGAEAEAPKPKSKKKLIIIAAVVVLLGGGGAAFAMKGAPKKEEKAAEEPAKVYKQAKLETFIVNLSENTSFLKTTIYLEYDPEIVHKMGGGGEESAGGHGGGHGDAAPDPTALPAVLKLREPMIMDSIIKILSSKKAAEVLTSEGKQALKDELVEAVNEAVGSDEPPITSIYFKDFLIQ